MYVLFGYPGHGVLSHQTIGIAIMMSITIILQIILGRLVICIKRILKLKRQTVNRALQDLTINDDFNAVICRASCITCFAGVTPLLLLFYAP